MAILRYDGPLDTRELWGEVFPRGELVEIHDAALLEKALRLDGFVRVDKGPDPELTKPPADDYEVTGEVETLFPEVGSGLVPEGWEGLHWKQRVKLAKDLTGKDCANGTEADAAIREALEAK